MGKPNTSIEIKELVEFLKAWRIPSEGTIHDMQVERYGLIALGFLYDDLFKFLELKREEKE